MFILFFSPFHTLVKKLNIFPLPLVLQKNCMKALRWLFWLYYQQQTHSSQDKGGGGGEYAVLWESCLCAEDIPDSYMKNISTSHMLHSDIHCCSWKLSLLSSLIAWIKLIYGKSIWALINLLQFHFTDFINVNKTSHAFCITAF